LVMWPGCRRGVVQSVALPIAQWCKSVHSVGYFYYMICEIF
jgi:hypothetical protein